MPNTYSEFLKSLEGEGPLNDWPIELKALWYDAKNDWHAAHDIVDGMPGAMANKIHAYLHRKEGDEWNAGYWYRRAGKPFPKMSLEEEHQKLVEFFLRG